MKYSQYLIFVALILFSGCAASNFQNTPNTGMKSGGAKGKVRIFVPWEKDRVSMLCTAEETDSAGYKLQSIVIYQDSISQSTELYSARNRDYPLAILPMMDETRNLLTIWDTGREYRLRMYSFSDGKVTQLFEDMTKTYPELFFEKKEREFMSILITNTDLVKNKKTKELDEQPVNATLYRWKDGKYVKTPNVQWSKRFSNVK